MLDLMGKMRYIILLIVLTLITTLSLFLTGTVNGSESHSYLLLITGLCIGIIIILGGCELFANGVECFGDRFNMSHATVGSLLAAVGTAMPETLIPILALLFAGKGHREGIAVGAILGAPFMLGTLAMFLLGITLFIRKLIKKRPRAEMDVNLSALTFEMKYFLVIMSFLLLVSIIKNPLINHITGGLLIVVYGIFFFYSLKHEAEEGEEYTDNFHFGLFLGCPRRVRWISFQILIGLFFIITGANLFIGYLTAFSLKTGIPALILSLLITPIATELPEKFNSITWTLKGKDTIALGNLSGAMVFQATIPASIGLLFTDWTLGTRELFTIGSALFMGAIILSYVSYKKRLPATVLLIGGVFYFIYVLTVFI